MERILTQCSCETCWSFSWFLSFSSYCSLWVSWNLTHHFLQLSLAPFHWQTFLSGCGISRDPLLAEVHALLSVHHPKLPSHTCFEHNHKYSLVFFCICHSPWEAAIGLIAQRNKPCQISSLSICIGTPLYVFACMQIVFITLHECLSSPVLCFLPLWLFICSSLFVQPLLCLAKQTNTLLIVPH